MKAKNTLVLLLATTMVAACVGGKKNDNGGGGASADVNPFADGNIPKQKESIRLVTGIGEGIVLTLDPVEGTFSFKDDKGLFVTKGDYDPDKFTVTQTSCESVFDDFCETPDGDDASLKDYFAGIEGDRLVWFNDSLEGLAVFGYNPTDEASLPSGKATYTGKFAADVYNGEFFRVDGDAKTVVDFDTDKLSTEFSNFSDDGIVSAGIDDVNLDGRTFSGGEFTFTTTEGTFEGGDTLVYGEFFGEKGQELGASMLYELYENLEDEDPSIAVFGVWTGKK